LRRVIADVETFCDGDKQVRGLSKELIISRTKWNEEFVVDVPYCQLLKDDLLDVLQRNYEKLAPSNINEKQPSKQTC